MISELPAADALAHLPIFEGMTADERRQMLEIATPVRYEPGDLVLSQGKNSRNLLVVLDGKCQVVKQQASTPDCQTVLAELAAGEHFGEMSFFHAAPHSASVRAVTPLRVLRWQHTDYDALLKQGSLAAYKLAYNVLDDFAERLRRMDEWVTDLLCHSEVGKEIGPPRPTSEWSKFREKLFNGWNL